MFLLRMMRAIRAASERGEGKPALFNALLARRRTRLAEIAEISEGNIKPDPALSARIRAYTALSMVERYGEHGPP
jgi:hypothetical protein